MSADDNVYSNSSSEGALDLDQATEAILGNWEDAEKLSEETQEAAEDPTESETDVGDPVETEDEIDQEETDQDEEMDPDEEDQEDGEEADEETDELEEEEEVLEFDDDTLVDITVDGQSKQASIAQLKRLYGQEQSLTRKSQEAASTRKTAEEQLQKADASLQAMLSRAQERFKPYSEVDMLVASRNMNAEDFTQLRAEAKQAEDDLKFLSEEADQFYGFVKNQRAQDQKQQAVECVKVLQSEIPDWNNSMYNDIRTYAISNGLPEDQVNQFTDPNVIMLLNKARMFDHNSKVSTVKKVKQAKKVLRSKKAPPSKADKKVERQKANVQRLQENSNDMDAIAAVIMSNWE
jgi:translation elongation factor P/translation initiation factor 5A